ncbi:hypothetical protein, partial [Citrobacter amalonaticus]|uniref:hypothetical protein n=1 Tax=Citrobacter amalonaticus TaxID=35703 RepID=UPI004041C310
IIKVLRAPPIIIGNMAYPVPPILPVATPVALISPKPTFLKMHNYQSNGMISHFNGMKNHAYWICPRINK